MFDEIIELVGYHDTQTTQLGFILRKVAYDMELKKEHGNELENNLTTLFGRTDDRYEGEKVFDDQQ
jgi:hypothetical protein